VTHRPVHGSVSPARLLPGTLLAAAGCLVMLARFGPSPVLAAYCYLAVAGAVLAVIDTREQRLPDLVTLPSYLAAVALLGIAATTVPGGGGQFAGALLGMIAALATFAAQAFLHPAGLGWGDVKLSGILGLYLGWLGPGVLLAGLFLGYVLAAATGLALIAARRATRKTLLPFGPFLLAGALAAIVLSGLAPAVPW
jgi:leader peptidase (prepilin peptidase) / N-methyltransferase